MNQLVDNNFDLIEIVPSIKVNDVLSSRRLLHGRGPRDLFAANRQAVQGDSPGARVYWVLGDLGRVRNGLVVRVVFGDREGCIGSAAGVAAAR